MEDFNDIISDVACQSYASGKIYRWCRK